MYWRKANQIHNWFVEHCGDGVDECQRIPVKREDLETLLDTCRQVLNSFDKLEEKWQQSFGGCGRSQLKEKLTLVKQVGDHFEPTGEKLAKDLQVGDLLKSRFSDEQAHKVMSIEKKTVEEDGKKKVVVAFNFDTLYRIFLIKDTSVAEELLPTCQGFFFGSTDYDNWYVQDLTDTVNALEQILKEDDPEDYDISYYYVASW